MRFYFKDDHATTISAVSEARRRKTIMEKRMLSRRTSLETRHQALESEIASEASRTNPDQLRISALKRQKLLIKDELSALDRRGRRRRRLQRATGIAALRSEGRLLHGFGAD